MAKPYYIIDGYNLMHAAGMARQQYGPGDLERCRNRLLAFLCDHLTTSERRRTTVVFDAANAPPGLERTATVEGMSIEFAPRNSDADTMIEELVSAHSAPRQIRLISSDHRLQKAIRKRRGRFFDSEQFVAQLENRETAHAENEQQRLKSIPTRKLTGNVSPEEVSELLDVFGEIAESQELTSGIERLQQEVDKLVDEAGDETDA